MSRHILQRTSVSELMGTRVVDVAGKVCGHITEFAVAPLTDANHVVALIIRRSDGDRRPGMLSVNSLRSLGPGRLQTADACAIEAAPTHDDFLLLERDLLDQQIIDVHGHKVVRVNDVDLAWEQGTDASPGLSLRIAEVEVGLRGATRRLLKGLPSATVERISRQFKPAVIPWDFVDLIDRDPARRVRLKIEQDRLSHMHPSDIADILEELAPAERESLFASLDEEVAAEALEEVEPKTQRAIIDALDSHRLAGIVEEMDPGAAADLLSELPDERSEAILEEMHPEERQDVEELLEFSGNSAAGRMTTDFVSCLPTDTVSSAIEALKAFEDFGDVDTAAFIYLLDAGERLSGIVPLARLLLASTQTQLVHLQAEHMHTCNQHDSGKKVAELFDKYNLRTLPVVDEEGCLIGVIHAEQVISMLRGRH